MLWSCRWRFYASCFCRQIGGFQFSVVSGGSGKDSRPTRRAALSRRCSWILLLFLLMCRSCSLPPCQALTRFPASALIGKNRWWMGQLRKVTSLLLSDWGQEQTSVSASFGCFRDDHMSSQPWIKFVYRKWPKYKWERTPCISTVVRKGLCLVGDETSGQTPGHSESWIDTWLLLRHFCIIGPPRHDVKSPLNFYNLFFLWHCLFVGWAESWRET